MQKNTEEGKKKRKQITILIFFCCCCLLNKFLIASGYNLNCFCASFWKAESHSFISYFLKNCLLIYECVIETVHITFKSTNNSYFSNKTTTNITSKIFKWPSYLSYAKYDSPTCLDKELNEFGLQLPVLYASRKLDF